MKILVFSPGYLGGKIVDALCDRKHEVVPVKVEITNLAAVSAALDEHRPDAVLNCAGKKGTPNVDWCETHQIETMRSNTIGPLVIAEACVDRGIHLTHLGTGCIFYGQSPDPKGWKEDDHANPSAMYTRSKYAADLILTRLPNIAIVRLRMPIDEVPDPGNLINKVMSYPKIIDVENSVTVVSDLINAVIGVIEKKGTGVFHAVNEGTMKHRDLIALYEELVDPSHTNEWISSDDLVKLGLATKGRSNCIMQNNRLKEIGVEMRPISVALRDCLEKYAENLKNIKD
ncbi:MAG: sugar nucleotide-binding protein [Patescibacteria group bacterium]|nr:sugar nucleotide-binding protein [Patescibacteria group bacterium]